MKYLSCLTLLLLLTMSISACGKEIVEVEKIVEKPVIQIVEVEKPVIQIVEREVERKYEAAMSVGVTTDGEQTNDRDNPKLRFWITVEYDYGDMSKHLVAVGDGALMLTIPGVNVKITVEEFDVEGEPVEPTPPAEPEDPSKENNDEF